MLTSSSALPQALILANDGRAELWRVEVDYSDDLLAAIDRLRRRSEVLNCSMPDLLDLIDKKLLGLILGECADESMGLVGIAGKICRSGENIVHLDVEARRPVSPSMSEYLASGLEWAARMDTGICDLVRISATGRFPVPAGYEIEEFTNNCRVMSRRLIAS